MNDLSIATKQAALSPRCPHPWRRFWARTLDWGIYSSLWRAFVVLILRENAINDGLGTTLVGVYASYVLMFFCEPLMLAYLGTTPGKWLLGLGVRHHSGRRLTYREGLWRTWQMFCQGNGLGIPFFDCYRNYKSYTPCLEGEQLPWDVECRFVVKASSWRQPAMYVTVWLLTVALSLLAQTAAELPRHRGDITAAEFVENMNDLAGYHEFNRGHALAADGTWRSLPPQGGVVYSMMQIMPDFQLTEENGVLTAVRFRQEYRGLVNYRDLQDQMYLAALSFVGAQQGVGIVQVLDKRYLLDTIYGPPEDFTIERAGITITCRVSGQYAYHNSGRTDTYTYRHSLGLLFIPEDSAVVLEFTMIKAAP